jgi:predicted alpha/beta-fold hydrolase
VVERIRIPTLVVTAEDDPFVPPKPFHNPELAHNPHVRVFVTRHGGHCAFVSEPDGVDDGYWAEWMVVRFASEVLVLSSAACGFSRTGPEPATGRTPALFPALRA